jgi:hypothetical protein
LLQFSKETFSKAFHYIIFPIPHLFLVKPGGKNDTVFWWLVLMFLVIIDQKIKENKKYDN